MPDLSERSLSAWLAKLPEDLRLAISSDGEVASIGSGDLLASLNSVTPLEVPALVRLHSADTRSFGRARRIRLMAWMAKEAGEPAPVFARLTEDETGDAEGSTGGHADIGILFLEDIKALANALGPRIARRMASNATMAAVIQSAFNLESDVEFRQGGMR